ncbi:MAG TPA: HDOD domain-containing protein [Bryobacteraceae bacterium]|nr:HDOD domain-containing protein [Bryobacteraceae bacterium]
MEVFVARQPIFDRDRGLYGYELLYRSTQSRDEFDGAEDYSATAQVISGILLSIGLDQIVGGKKAFLNFSDRLLRDGLHLSLPADVAVIEILETVRPDANLIALCRAVRDQGYTLALDDFVGDPAFEPLTELAHLIKVDIQQTRKSEQQRLLRRYRPRGIALLAEKVETQEEFEWARRAGYDYFQGYFFARPVVVRGKQVPAAKINCLRLLSEMQAPELDFRRLEKLIEADVALAYKLLRYVNSALFGRRAEIQSIQRALTIMGASEIRRWSALAAVPALATDKPGELATLALVRARFCERLMEITALARRNEAFLMGLFSLLDALLDCPLDQALGSVALGGGIRQVLLDAAPENDTLRNIYRLTRCYENGDWDEVEDLARGCGLKGSEVGAAYVEATLWARQMLQAVSG